MEKEKKELSPFVETILRKASGKDTVAKPQSLTAGMEVKKDPELKHSSLFMKDEDVRKVEEEIKKMKDKIK
jgi:hypothetical protein